MKTKYLVLISMMGATAAIAQAPPAPATDEVAAIRNLRIVPPKRVTVSAQQQEYNKRIVLQFHYEFFDLGHTREAADKYLAPNYKVNDPREPSGREAYVNFFLKQEAGRGGSPPPASASTSEGQPGGNLPLSAMRNPANRPAVKALLATDDLVMLIFDGSVPWPKGPEGKYKYISCDLFRLENGKIVESWFSGVPAAPTD